MELVLKNCSVFATRKEVTDRRWIAIRDGVFVGVESGSPPGAKPGRLVVDMEGRYVLPGLIDVHTHLVGGDKAIGHGENSRTFKMDEPVPKAVLESVYAARQTIDAGFTTVRDLGARDWIDVFLRDAQRAGLIVGPRILATGSGVFMTGGHGSFWAPADGADSPAEVRKRVRRLVAHGVDVIKVVSADGPETVGDWSTPQSSDEEIAAAFSEARRLGRRTAAHAMGSTGVMSVVAAGGDTVEHGWFMDDEASRTLGSSRTFLGPTLGMAVDIAKKGPALGMPWAEQLDSELDGIFSRIERAIHDGVRIVLGSDCGGAEARLHGSNADEIAHYVECGLTPRDALLSATATAAEALKLSASLGAIEPGLAADLIALDRDPLLDPAAVTTSISTVIQAGVAIRDDPGSLGARATAGSAQLETLAAFQA